MQLKNEVMEKIHIYRDKYINRKICKYFSIDNNFYNSISNNYLWFSDPLTFNDPYDCNLQIDIENSEEEIRDFFTTRRNELIINGDSRWQNLNINEKVKLFRDDPALQKKTIHDIFLNEIIPGYGICCFSEDEMNMLMWSHYADSHKGLCLVFDILHDRKFFRIPLQVEYPPSYPKFNYIRYKKTKENLLIQFLLGTKSQDWNYESEVRVVKDSIDYPAFRGEIKFDKACLVEVIFGFKLSRDQKKIDFLKNLFNCFGYSPDFFKMELKESEFGLNKLQCS